MSGTKIKVGQVYQDNDPRSAGRVAGKPSVPRRIRVTGIVGDKAEVVNMATGHTTWVKLARLGTSAKTGYSLVSS